MTLKFYGEDFPFELLEYSNCSIRCRLMHSENSQKRFTELCEAEALHEDDVGPWYLDEHGERLEADELFRASPWSLEGAEGELKLLSRLHKPNGEIFFNIPEGYEGELSDWIRGENMSIGACSSTS